MPPPWKRSHTHAAPPGPCGLLAVAARFLLRFSLLPCPPLLLALLLVPCLPCLKRDCARVAPRPRGRFAVATRWSVICLALLPVLSPASCTRFCPLLCCLRHQKRDMTPAASCTCGLSAVATGRLPAPACFLLSSPFPVLAVLSALYSLLSWLLAPLCACVARSATVAFPVEPRRGNTAELG